MKKIMIFFFYCLISEFAYTQAFTGTSNLLVVNIPAPPVNAKKNDMDATLADWGFTKLPKYHALIVGVSEYENEGPGLPNLDMPAKDAEHLYTVLTEKYAFEPANVILLKNPTREEIINQFDHLAEIVAVKDNLLIFYAGHGFYDKEKDFGYWLPSDAKKNSRSAWIANSTIKDYVGAIKAKHTLLITDACFGGSIFKSRSVESDMRRFNEMYKDKSRKAITSGNLTEVPDQSVFLKFVLKNLDENTEPYISASTLFNKIYEPVMNNASSTPKIGVIQGAGDEGGDFLFIKKIK